MSNEIRLRSAKQSIESANTILKDCAFEDLEYMQIKAAAGQLHQAAADLFILAGAFDQIQRSKNKKEL